jgi:archaeal flagellar protein FlaI
MVKTKIEKNYKVLSDAGQKILRINYEGHVITPSIEEKPFCMSQVIHILMEEGAVTQIIFTQREDFIYEEVQAKMLSEVAELIKELIQQERVLETTTLGSGCSNCFASRHAFMNVFVMAELREDPIGAYLHLIERAQREKTASTCSTCNSNNKKFASLLSMIFTKMSKLTLIKQAQPYLKDYDPKTRFAYTQIFKPIIKPNFLYAKVQKTFPIRAVELDAYSVSDSKVVIFKKKDSIRPIYHVIPPEYDLLEEQYALLGKAKEVLASHRPRKAEFVDPERTREVFKRVGMDLVMDLSKHDGLDLSSEMISKLSDIIVRYTVGFGLIEILLRDPQIQDVSINAPASMTPITIIHAKYGECITNLTVTPRDVESWATKLRLISGRPLDESNPVLDTELLIPGARTRVAVIQEPLSPAGLAFSFRRHRDKPWTLPLFVKNRMITPLAGGLLSFFVDGGRTMLVAGTRSAGKTSLLSSLLVQIMRSIRIITIEDTLEIPVAALKKLNYDIQSLKVQSVITSGKQEISAADGIRTSLRMGDSSLIIGEVRSDEALALYEAMRVGALANVVAGTIHGDSPYGVFDRVVNDLKVPPTSFKATDIIVVCNPVKSASGLKKTRRVVQITEVRKNWSKDPLTEHGFVDLMIYNPKTDQLEPTAALLQGESDIIKSIGSRVRAWAGDFDAIWKNIELRAKVIKTIADLAESEKKSAMLEADFVVKSNDVLHSTIDCMSDEDGAMNVDAVFNNWISWCKQEAQKVDKDESQE